MEEQRTTDHMEQGMAPSCQASPQETSVSWYHNVSLEDAEIYIKANLQSAVRSVIAVGYYLKCIRDGELYLAEGYQTIWEYAMDRFGFSVSTASRYMARNDRFSKNGNSPILDEKYRKFSKSQLQEMLSLTDDQLEMITPDMTVRQIRELKKPAREIPYYEIPGQMEMTLTPEELGISGMETFQAAGVPEEIRPIPNSQQSYLIRTSDLLPESGPKTNEEEPRNFATSQQMQTIRCESSSELGQNVAEMAAEPLSAYGTPKRVYPPGSLIATEGCAGGMHDCFSCAMECQIRQKGRYCREAPLGNPFFCEVVQYGFSELPKSCQFVNHELAEHCAGSGEPDPCCKTCQDPCEYICSRAMKALDAPTCLELEKDEEPQEPEQSDMELLQKMLEKEKKLLEEMNRVNETEPDSFIGQLIRKKKLLVGALAGMLCTMNLPEVREELTQEQLELPTLKNSEQRKEWLRNYKNWGLWYEDEHIGVRYYKYDFDNGAKLIVEELSDESAFYHLVGGPKPPAHPKFGYGKWSRHETYCHHPDSETELIEFLKEVQKR